MSEETYSIWLQNSLHNKKIHNLIKRYASEENKDSFSPHVTLVSNINSKENALKILQKLSDNKSSIVFDKVSTEILTFKSCISNHQTILIFLTLFQK